MLTHIDLFSGLGGFALAAQWAGFRTVVFCEIDPFCQEVLKHHWPGVPIFGDIKDLNWLLDENDGKSIIEICEQISNEPQTSEISSSPLMQQGSRRSLGDVRIAEKKRRSVQVKQGPEWENSVPTNVATNSSAGITAQTLGAGNGCAENQTLIGKTDEGMIGKKDTTKIGLPNGDGGSTREILTPAKIADYVRRKKANSTLTTSKPGEIFPASDSSSATGLPCVKNATKKDTGTIDLLTGGFPCQGFSYAGKRKGRGDDRYLWPEMFRVIQRLHPRWIVAENVPGLISIENGLVFEQVCLDLEGQGYEVQPLVIPACAVNAPHRRDRVWIIGHTKCEGFIGSTTPDKPNRHAKDTFGRRNGRRGDGPEKSKRNGMESEIQIEGSDRPAPFSAGGEPGQSPQQKGRAGSRRRDSDAPDAERKQPNRRKKTWRGRGGLKDFDWDAPWPEVATRLCRVDDGLPAWIYRRRTERLKALGNSIVPQVAYQIIKEIAEIERGKTA